MRWLIRVVFTIFFALHAVAYAIPEQSLRGGAVFKILTSIAPVGWWVAWFAALAAVAGFGLRRSIGACSRMSGFAAVTAGCATLAFMIAASVFSAATLLFFPITLVSYSIFLCMFIWCAATTIWPRGL